ncbi:hypothetical protein PMZ80_004591 [Knufia obscura]|uniref:Uncharacterized protein n=1 Tax=Knufia obscura TaxID=1635080 RepID=A0ABR0RTH4_9EURO|nr:hypothetical protein PMZ80_004591 [Knufia obscura]
MARPHHLIVHQAEVDTPQRSLMSTVSLAHGFASAAAPDDTTTQALLAAAQAATAAHEHDASNPIQLESDLASYAEPKVENGDSLAPLPTAESLPGRVAKPRARKSPGSGAKRSEPSKRKFICSFSHYGCDVALSSKNEWKRHVSIQHLQLGFYRCDVGSCNPDNNPNTPPHKKVYNDFNRKDLFTQHHRRMHKPEGNSGSGTIVQDPNSQDWRQFEDSLEEVRNRCWHEKRKPPQRSTCGFCGRVFEGEGSWNERMEHVGGHYSRDLPEACKEEREDEDLTNWCLQNGVVKEAPNGRHVLVDQPVSSVDKTFNNRNIDMTMSDAPPITPTNGQMDGQFIGMDDSRRQSLQQGEYPPVNINGNGTGRPGSSSGQHNAPHPLSCYSNSWKDAVPPLPELEPMPNDRDDTDRLEDLINTLINPKKPRMSKRLQWRCDCGLDSSVDFADENNDDHRAFQNLGKISIICKDSQSPYLKTSKTEQYEIIPCNELHRYIDREGKIPTDHSLPRLEESTEQDANVEGDVTAPALETEA